MLPWLTVVHKSCTLIDQTISDSFIPIYSNLQAAASAAELQEKKIDVGGLQDSSFGKGIRGLDA